MNSAKLGAALALSILFVAACDSIVDKSPAETVAAAYMAANEGRYSEAKEYLSSAVIKVAEGDLGALAGGLRGMWDEITRNGTIREIEVLSEEVRGEGATVRFKIHYEDGRTKNEDEPLVQEDGQWKLDVG